MSFQPSYHETINQLLYGILKQLDGKPVEVPLPPYHNITDSLLYEILRKLEQQQQNVTARKHSVTITGDGSTKSFTINHNLDSEDLVLCAREVTDNLKQVFLDNYPDPSDPKNKLIVSFDFAPDISTSFRISIIG